MIFNGVCLVTEDVSKLAEFYRSVLRTTVENDNVHAEVRTEGAGLAIFARTASEGFAPSQGNACNRSFSMGFIVDDVDAEYERLKALAVEFLSKPTTHPWGWRSFTFKTPMAT